MSIPTREEVLAFEAADLVTVRPHNTLPLRIVNYTPKAQYEQAWTPSLLPCRGLVFDAEWNLVARPLPKFFNYEEHGEGTVAGPLPEGPFTVTEKYDGSLGIIFRWHEHLVLSTRGSFHSEQAARGMQMLARLSGVEKSLIGHGHTHLVEIIYPQNRIVVSYGHDERLQYLTSIETATGSEAPHVVATVFGGTPKEYPGNAPFEVMKRQHRANSEGYVLRYANGQRVKIKFDEYVRLHALVTGLDTVRIWEVLRAGEDPLAALAEIPDELYGWASIQVNELRAQHVQMNIGAQRRLNDIREQVGWNASRKELAALILRDPQPHLLFLVLDGNDSKLSDAIWKEITPERQRPITGNQC